MRFLADMGISRTVAEWLRSHGHDVGHLLDLGLESAADVDIAELARHEGRIILTFDLDFGEIAILATNRPISVILFRLHVERPANVIRRLDAALTKCVDALNSGALILVEESRFRVRRLTDTLTE